MWRDSKNVAIFLVLFCNLTCISLQDINTNVVNDIVLSYLIHNGYQKSAESFIACTEMKRPADQLENMEKRTSRFIILVFQCI